MTQSNSLELAKQGDPQAIASLMNRSLQPKGLTAKAEWVGERLQVVLEAEQVPNRQVLTNFVQTGLQKLGIPAIQTVEILGKQASAAAPAWSEEITLAAPAISAPTPPVAPPPAPPRAAPVPPPLPRNPNIVVSEVPSALSVEPEVPPAGEANAPEGLDQDLALNNALDNEAMDDTSPLLASMTFTQGGSRSEPTAQFDELAADLNAVPLGAEEPELGDTPGDLRGNFADEFAESDRPAPGGFVLPELHGNELPTVTDSLALDALQDFEDIPPEPQDSLPLVGFEDEVDPLFDEGNQDIYLPSDELDGLETNGNVPSSDLFIDDDLETNEPQFFSPEEDIYSENETSSEPVVEYVNEPGTGAANSDNDAGADEGGLPIDDDEEFVEERNGMPATGWFAAGLLGILVFGLLGYSLFSSSLGGRSLVSRIFGLSSDEPSPPVASVTPLPSPTASVATSPSPAAANTAPLQAATALEQKIAGLEANAQSADDWSLIVGQWQAAIALLQQVPANSPDGAAAQQKLAVFQQKLAAAQQNISPPAAANTPSSTTTTTIAGNVACQAVPSQSDSQPVELGNLQIQPGQNGNVMVGCLTNHTDQAIAQVSVSYEALSDQDPNLAQGGLSQIASTPLQPRETVPFTGSFTLNPDLNSVKIESIFWTPAGTQEPQRIPTELVLAP